MTELREEARTQCNPWKKRRNPSQPRMPKRAVEPTPETAAPTPDLFAKPAPPQPVENPFGPEPKLAETKPVDPFVHVAEAPKAPESVEAAEAPAVETEPAASRSKR